MKEPVHAEGQLSTGVPGLDIVLSGGLPRGGVYIIEGPPGGGKTILGNQIAYHVASQGQNAVYLTLLAESHARMLGHLRVLDFFRAELVGPSVRYASGFKTLETEGLNGLLRLTREMVTQQTTTLLVIDGLVSALESAPTDRDYRKFVHELQTLTGMTGCTALLLTSVDRSPSTRPEHTMVDGIIEITDALNNLRSVRHLQVRKLRGRDPVRGQHTLSITHRGITVRPRIEAELLRLPESAPLTPSRDRTPLGVWKLDQMLQGGLPQRSTTMLLGPSGSGKTLLGLQFLAKGMQQGELCAYFGFYERPATLLAKAERIKIPLKEGHQRGLIEFLWEPFGEASIDTLGARLLKTVRELRPRRLFLDGLQGFQQSVDVPERLGSVFSTIAEELELHEVTTIYTLEAEQLLGDSVRSPIRGVSAITHNILLLSQEERDARLRRMFSIVKMRDGGYDSSVRELCITDSGIQIGDAPSPQRGRQHEPPHAVAPVPPAPCGQAAPRGSSRGHILIVDDEFGLADLIAEILSERGYGTAIAINGELGLLALRERRADLVLLDLMMPVMSGPEMLRRMREEPAFAAIPVVLMTALLEAVPREERALYAAVLQKPFTPEQLFEVIGQILGTARVDRGSAA
jgi:circadian clock protein KaiC